MIPRWRVSFRGQRNLDFSKFSIPPIFSSTILGEGVYVSPAAVQMMEALGALQADTNRLRSSLHELQSLLFTTQTVRKVSLRRYDAAYPPSAPLFRTVSPPPVYYFWYLCALPNLCTPGYPGKFSGGPLRPPDEAPDAPFLTCVFCFYFIFPSLKSKKMTVLTHLTGPEVVHQYI